MSFQIRKKKKKKIFSLTIRDSYIFSWISFSSNTTECCYLFINLQLWSIPFKEIVFTNQFNLYFMSIKSNHFHLPEIWCHGNELYFFSLAFKGLVISLRQWVSRIKRWDLEKGFSYFIAFFVLCASIFRINEKSLIYVNIKI